ncbi:hypothetical protein M316_0042 [Nitrincola phage 1M3-16]|uniref:hypothetical protein n=1 Tax=Nitrincola phage 1M3-16 TaxID=1472912 RepID=UPI000444CEC1|nr:hypothetical protein GJ22_gp110 [Nitrincola phage 1M3-16]AHX01107.1 hypothetical protein M316_0042 [Nitrincola phage 1M3-16]
MPKFTDEQRQLYREGNRYICKGEKLHRELFSQFRDPDKQYITFEMLLDINERIYLSIEDPDVVLLDIVEEVLVEHGSGLDLYAEAGNISLPHNFSKEVFERLQDHPIQKMLCRKKMLSKRTLKKSRTPKQHINTVWSSKMKYHESIRVDRLEQEHKVMSAKIHALQVMIEEGLGKNKEIQSFLMKEQGLTNKQISEVMQVSVRTIKRWIAKVRGQI